MDNFLINPIASIDLGGTIIVEFVMKIQKSHRNILFIVCGPQHDMRVTSLLEVANQERLTDIIQGDEAIAATFAVHKLNVVLKLGNGSVIHFSEAIGGDTQ